MCIQIYRYRIYHLQPTMIAESTPFGGIHLDSTPNVTEIIKRGNPWDRWFDKVITLIEKHDISMWSYINCDWTSQPMWRDTGFGDTRLSTSEIVMQHWQEKIVESHGSQKFLMNGSLEPCIVSTRELILDDQHPAYWAITTMLCALVILILNIKKAMAKQRYDTIVDERTFLKK